MFNKIVPLALVVALGFGSAAAALNEIGTIASVDIVGDTEPPPLAVSLPEAAVERDRLTVRGTTAPGTRLLIGSQAVAVDAAGGFEHEITLQPGPNLVVVEALDEAGNVTYHSQYVYAKF